MTSLVSLYLLKFWRYFRFQGGGGGSVSAPNGARVNGYSPSRLSRCEVSHFNALRSSQYTFADYTVRFDGTLMCWKRRCICMHIHMYTVVSCV